MRLFTHLSQGVPNPRSTEYLKTFSVSFGVPLSWMGTVALVTRAGRVGARRDAGGCFKSSQFDAAELMVVRDLFMRTSRIGVFDGS